MANSQQMTSESLIESYDNGFSTLRRFAFGESVEYTKNKSVRTFIARESNIEELFFLNKDVNILVCAVIRHNKKIETIEHIIKNMENKTIHKVHNDKTIDNINKANPEYLKFLDTIVSSDDKQMMEILSNTLMYPKTSKLHDSLSDVYDDTDGEVWDMVVSTF